MKKLTALLLVAMMAIAMMPTAMAASVYTAVTPDSTKMPAINHTLTLTGEDMDELAYDITYKFAVSKVEIVEPNYIEANKDMMVTGAPSIADLQYKTTDSFSADNKACTKALSVDWSNVVIKQPGVYKWAVTKSVVEEDPNNNPTNKSVTTYLYLYAADENGKLVIKDFGMTSATGLDDEEVKNDHLDDQFPAKTLDLNLTKNVTGTQGSKDQYFMFTLSLTPPAGAAERTYQITGTIQEDVPATPYNTAKTNTLEITAKGGQTVKLDLWMKDGQTATVNNLLFGTAFTITEDPESAEGYGVTNQVFEEGMTETPAFVEGYSASANSIAQTTTVTFKNEKNATVPTGVTLQTAAPVAGMMLALAMLALLFVGKRKENMA